MTKKANPHTATFQFIGSLVDFFTGTQGKVYTCSVSFRLHPAARDLIESHGVTHVEVYALRMMNLAKVLCYSSILCSEL